MIEAHSRVCRADARKRMVELFKLVGIPTPERRIHEFPHKLSGGMHQRATIAEALANEPELLILDEPTIALNVTIQAQILDLVRGLRRAAVLLITRDIGIVRAICDEVLVMYGCRVMEWGKVDQVTDAPKHLYTIGLLASIPHPEMRGQQRNAIGGEVPNPLNVPSGCHSSLIARMAPWSPVGSTDSLGKLLTLNGTTTKTSKGTGALTDLVEIRNLGIFYSSRSGFLKRNTYWVKAVNDVSFQIDQAKTFGLDGVSGCGKSSVGRSILRLETPQAGEMLFQGEDILAASPSRPKSMGRDVQAIFQYTHGSLDPRMSVRSIVSEGLIVQGKLRHRDQREFVKHLIDLVGLRKEHLERFPHEFSGGQRRRIAIARALALRPKLIVAAEPGSALDVSVQSQVRLSDLQSEFGLRYLFISHDLSVVEYFSDRVGVMYLGEPVELADAEDLYADSWMPHTMVHLSAAPDARRGRKSERIVLRGDRRAARAAIRLPVSHALVAGRRDLRAEGPRLA
ncbi:dipeptide ABC transporter ATP-binding protein [Bradyrhizobium diazoefficiens]|uniref:dipeptide ABC transporter ATP-binding protein n=1 Tax=Bradyrhizobium diazoefficiens TaxID=1355477 RepID=UPI001FF03728|nr:ABC transporter ATP-binding protein [Bradyrhizobium diazoefficiens]